MLSECPQCGQKLRPQWVRCPRCRVLLPQVAGVNARAVGSEPKDGSWRRMWFAAAGAAGVVLLLVTVSMRGEAPTATAASRAQAPRAVRDSAHKAAADEGQADDNAAPSPTVAFDALDSKRAATAAYAAGDFATAIAQLEAAVTASPGDPEARNNLAQVLVRQGRAAEALPHLDEAVRIDATTWDYRFNRARAYGLLNRWPEAVAEYRAAANIFPDDHATLYNLGLALIRVRDYGAAAASLEQAVAAAPEEHDFLISLGTAYVGASQHDRARVVFERFLRLAPNDPEAPKVKALLQALGESAS